MRDISEGVKRTWEHTKSEAGKFYRAHTKDEYVVLSEMHESILAACDILERTTYGDVFAYVEAYDDDIYGWVKEDKQYLIEYKNKRTKQYECVEITALSKAEAVGKFCIDHTDIPYNDIEVWEY